MNNIYLDSRLDGLGHSCVLRFSGADGTISIGQTAAYNGGVQYEVLIASFSMMDISVIGGPVEYAEYFTLRNQEPPPQEYEKFMWKLLFKVITPDHFKAALKQAYEKGAKQGRVELQCQFRSLLGVPGI